MFINFAKCKVIELACLIATLLNIALPTIVIPAMIAAINEGTKIDKKLEPLSMAIFATMLAPAAPDKIPQISPITSHKIELTLSAFFVRIIACLLPLTFLEAIAVKCSMLLDATERPIMSAKTEIEIKTKITIVATIIVDLLKTSSLAMLNNKERDMAKTNTIIGHTQVFLFFDLFNFCFIYSKAF